MSSPTFSERQVKEFELWLNECRADKEHFLDWGFPILNKALRGIKGGMSILVGGQPNFGKPLSVNTKVLMGNGERKRLGEIKIGDYVITHKGIPSKVVKVYEQGKLNTLRILTSSGRIVVSALDHPFLTVNGWKEAQNLTTSDTLLLVSFPKINNTSGKSDDEFFKAGEKFRPDDFINYPNDIPEWVYLGSKNQIAKFFSGIIGTEKNKLKICTPFYKVAVELQHLLLRLGIKSDVTPRGLLGPGSMASVEVVDPANIKKFYSQINGNIANEESCLIQDKIINIKPSEMIDCRCISLENINTFTAEDIVVHNSQFQTSTILKILEKNEDAVVIDFSLDDPKKKRITQYISSLSKLDMNTVDFINKVSLPEKISRFNESCEKIKSWLKNNRLYIFEAYEDDSNQSDIISISNRAEEIRKIHSNKKLVISIDSLNDIDIRVRSDDPYIKSEGIAKEINKLIIRTDSVLIASTHLRKNGGRRPTIEDLKGNNFLAYSAKVAIGIHNDIKINKQKASVYWLATDSTGNSYKMPIVETHFLKSKVSDFNKSIVFKQWPAQGRLEEVEDQEFYEKLIYGE